MRGSLSPGLTDLLGNRIDSFEKLDLVVALHAAPRGTLSIDDLVRALDLPRGLVRRVATELRAASLVELSSRGDVQLLPPTDGERELIDELVTLVHADRVTVVRVMGELALARIRGLQ